MVKPGVKTTEFWMVVILQIILLLNTVQAWTYLPPHYSVMAQAILAGAYAIARGLAKISPATAAGVDVNYPPLEQPGSSGHASGEPDAKPHEVPAPVEPPPTT